MLPQMGPPETTIFEYPRGDESWKLEMAEFLEDIRTGRTPVPGLREARAALAVVESLYESGNRPACRTGREIGKAETNVKRPPVTL
jgi:predicted dehydrogenase